MNQAPEVSRFNIPARFNEWLGSRPVRYLLLAIAACLSLPAIFAKSPDMGLDPSWRLSLQLAAINDKVFGQEFIFTYGPLGYLLIHAPVNKAFQLIYDFFILGSLLNIYQALFPARPKLVDAFLLVALAIVTKACLGDCDPAVLFTILCYWLWRVYDQGDGLAMLGGIITALVLFFGKVNYGLMMVFLVPAYGAGLLLLHRQRRAHGILLLFGFPGLVWLGAMVWHVDLPNYLRSAVELISGYSEAMGISPVICPLEILFDFGLASLFLLALAITAWTGRNWLPWKSQTMILPLIGIAGLLLFKNAFSRSDVGHARSFFDALPLLLAVWWTSWRGARKVQCLMVASLFYPLAQLFVGTSFSDPTESATNAFSPTEPAEVLPLRYLQQAARLPMHQDFSMLQDNLRAAFPEAMLPAGIRTAIGRSSVDVMPWESSIAILNGLNYQPRPIPQSYAAYTPWLDNLNARFLASTNAPDYLLYACAQRNDVDYRPAAWDESMTKVALLENYTFDTKFKLPMKVVPKQDMDPAEVYLMKRTAHSRRLVPVRTNEVSLALNQTLSIPATTNLVFLTLKINRSFPGKLEAAALSPSLLYVKFTYQNHRSITCRAVLPILESGVLISRRVESAEEIGNWLMEKTARNMAVASVSFNSSSDWEFPSPFKGFLVEYRLVDNQENPNLAN